MHTNIHTCTRTHIHICINACTHAYIYTYIHRKVPRQFRVNEWTSVTFIFNISLTFCSAERWKCAHANDPVEQDSFHEETHRSWCEGRLPQQGLQQYFWWEQLGIHTLPKFIETAFTALPCTQYSPFIVGKVQRVVHKSSEVMCPRRFDVLSMFRQGYMMRC